MQYDGLIDISASHRTVPHTTATSGLRIGQLAERLGTTTKTLRFYEKAGLLGAAQRTHSGYRMYPEAAVARARLVLGLRRLGLSVDEVHALLRGDGGGLTLRQRLLALMDDKLREIELNLSVWQGRREDLAARHEALLAAPRQQPGECICAALLAPCSCTRKAPLAQSVAES